jgi:membrane protease YdiL (CAAX protease family)
MMRRLVDFIDARSNLCELPATRCEGAAGARHGFYFLLVFLALVVVVALVFFPLSHGLLAHSEDDDGLLGTLVGSIAAVWATRFAMGSFEARRFADIGLHWDRDGRRSLSLGFLVGFAGAVVVILVPVAMGLGKIQADEASKADLRNFVALLVMFLVQPLAEELVVRGYLFQTLIRRFTVVPAIVGTSALFAVMHVGNPSASALSTWSTFLVGVVLAFAVCRSGSLWLATGFHTGWNLALPLLGVNLSGIPIRMTRFELRGCTDALWCGGAYGVEASLPTMLLQAAMLVGVWYLPVKAPRRSEDERAGGVQDVSPFADRAAATGDEVTAGYLEASETD